jgi:hypothetical protein
VPRSAGTASAGYYEWLAGQPARQRRAEADDQLATEIRTIHGQHKGAYGSPRVARAITEMSTPEWRYDPA